MSLRDCHRYNKGGNVKKELCPGDVIVLYDDSSQREFWKMVKVKTLIRGVDEQVRGAVVRTSTLRLPVNRLIQYSLEV